MRRSLIPTALLLLGTAAGTAAAQASQGKQHGQAHRAAERPGAAAAGDQALIANALSAAPASVGATATVKSHDGRTLRPGTSEWVCMPDMADVPNDTPMCLDASWQGFLDALMNKRAPSVTRIGFGYMLQADLPVSNVDPYATAPSPTNQWIQDSGPHVMVIVPDQRLLDGLSTDPTNGGPFVMWKGTPYAHIMVPAPAMPKKP